VTRTVSEGGLEWLLPRPGRPYRWPRAVASSGVTSNFSPSPGTACRTVVPPPSCTPGWSYLQCARGTSSDDRAPKWAGSNKYLALRSSLSHHRPLWDVVQAGVAVRFPGSRRRSHSRSGLRPSSTERHRQRWLNPRLPNPMVGGPDQMHAALTALVAQGRAGSEERIVGSALPQLAQSRTGGR
jgi:hypothetical protein